jgi:hypothetical protein
VVNHNKRKIKSESFGENLSEAPKDERLDTLSKRYQEISYVLIEPIESINIGIAE